MSSEYSIEVEKRIRQFLRSVESALAVNGKKSEERSLVRDELENHIRSNLAALTCPVTPTSLGGLLTFSGTVRNAGNVRYKNFLSRYKEFALEPGRNIIIRVSTDQ